MADLTLEIIPRKGFGQINFGDPDEKVISYLGEPGDMEDIEDEDMFSTVILYYWDQKITAFFEGKEKSVVSCFETENKKATMYGKEIFNMKKEEIIDLMTRHGFKVTETEMEPSGEQRVSYDDALLDFFFQDGKLTAVNWGVLVNEEGEIEEL